MTDPLIRVHSHFASVLMPHQVIHRPTNPQTSIPPHPFAHSPASRQTHPHADLHTDAGPHQADGVKFMFNNISGNSATKLRKGQKGSGCILAHCMGLGKTLQVRQGRAGRGRAGQGGAGRGGVHVCMRVEGLTLRPHSRNVTPRPPLAPPL